MEIMTPFRSSAAREYIEGFIELCGEVKKGPFGPVNSLYECDIKTILPECHTEEEIKRSAKALRETSSMSEEEIEEALSDYSLDADIAYETWAAVCLLDAAVNGTDYSSECVGYAESYRRAVEALSADSQRKKLLSKKSVYDMPKILSMAVKTLDYVLGKADDCELAEEMHKNGEYDSFERSISELRERILSKF